MICRELQLKQGGLFWLLISQLEHARLSGWLAEQCLDRFESTADGALTEVRNELLAAIVHHDDGWRQWEAAPSLSATGSPLSFMDLPVRESLDNWTGSVEAAAEICNLAAWLVAGHFSAILVESDHHRADPLGPQWLADMAACREVWFRSWHEENNSVHTAQVAGLALKWLQLFDVLSLWPCVHYPLVDEVGSDAPTAYSLGPGWAEVREIRPDESNPNRMVVDPWPFPARPLRLIAEARLVPVGKYANAAELLAAAQPIEASWQLVPGEG